MEWILLLFVAGAVSLLFFMSGRFVTEEWIDRYYAEPSVTRRHDKKYISRLQKYITENEISSEEIGKLDDWIDDNWFIYMQVKKEDKWIYFSYDGMDEQEIDEHDLYMFPEGSYYDVELADGTVQVFILGMYYHNAYTIVTIFYISLSVMLFLMFTMLGIRGKIRYINRLSREIEILEGGNLEHEVWVQGKDELADLAKGLNMMRVSFQEQIQEVEELTRKNQEMVTEISHDLRTPLTSVLLYAEILKSGKYEGKEAGQAYLDKIVKKLMHMKDLSDGLLAYAVHAAEEKYVPAGYKAVSGLLYDELSDMCQYLEEQGQAVNTELEWKKGQICVYEEYLIRVFDNISSNILKYADRQEPVLIWDEYGAGEMHLLFENRCREDTFSEDHKSAEGYRIGIRNVRMMMEAMSGKCDVARDGKIFRICLGFRWYKEY